MAIFKKFLRKVRRATISKIEVLFSHPKDTHSFRARTPPLSKSWQDQKQAPLNPDEFIPLRRPLTIRNPDISNSSTSLLSNSSSLSVPQYLSSEAITPETFELQTSEEEERNDIKQVEDFGAQSFIRSISEPGFYSTVSEVEWETDDEGDKQPLLSQRTLSSPTCIRPLFQDYPSVPSMRGEGSRYPPYWHSHYQSVFTEELDESGGDGFPASRSSHSRLFAERHSGSCDAPLEADVPQLRRSSSFGIPSAPPELIPRRRDALAKVAAHLVMINHFAAKCRSGRSNIPLRHRSPRNARHSLATSGTYRRTVSWATYSVIESPAEAIECQAAIRWQAPPSQSPARTVQLPPRLPNIIITPPSPTFTDVTDVARIPARIPGWSSTTATQNQNYFSYMHHRRQRFLRRNWHAWTEKVAEVRFLSRRLQQATAELETIRKECPY